MVAIEVQQGLGHESARTVCTLDTNARLQMGKECCERELLEVYSRCGHGSLSYLLRLHQSHIDIHDVAVGHLSSILLRDTVHQFPTHWSGSDSRLPLSQLESVRSSVVYLCCCTRGCDGAVGRALAYQRCAHWSRAAYCIDLPQRFSSKPCTTMRWSRISIMLGATSAIPCSLHLPASTVI